MVLVRRLLTVVFVIAASGCGQATTAPSATPVASAQGAQSPAATVAELPTLTLEATIADSIGATEIVATDDALWALIHESALLVRIDPATNKITAKVQLEQGFASWLGLAGGRLWTYHQLLAKVVAVDPVSLKVVESIALGQQGDLFWVGDEAGWLIHGGTLNRVDGKTAEVTSTPMPACEVDAVATAGGFVWLASANGGLCKVDEKTGMLVEQALGEWHGSALAVLDDAVWMPAPDNGLAIVDATTLKVVDSLPPPPIGTFGGSKYSLGFADSEHPVIIGDAAGTSGWARYLGGSIGRVRPGADPAIVLFAGLPGGTYASAIVEAFGSLWVTNFTSEGVQRFALPTP